MNIDCILVNPRHLDYPLFRFNLLWMEKYFDKVFIALTQDTIQPDISDFLVKCKEYKKVRFIRPPKSDGKSDWRNLAVRDIIINFSRSEYVLFLEQDFLFKDYRLPEFLHKYDQKFLGYKEGERIHPAFALVSRDIIEKTSKDFSAYPDDLHLDHFGKFFKELDNLTDMRFIDEFGFNYKDHFYHLNGLSQNYMCFRENQPFYKPEEFLTYNHLCQKLLIQQSPHFLELMQNIEKKHGIGNIKFIKDFFPKEAKNHV